MSVVCPVCGTTNPEGAEYCEGCGIALASVGAAEPSTPVVEAEAQTDSEPSLDDAEQASGASAASPRTYGESPSTTATPLEAAIPSGPGTRGGDVIASNDPASASLVYKSLGAITSTTIPLAGTRLTVGRFDPSSGPVDIDLSGMAGHENISRRHAEIYQDQGFWHIRDLGSTNGVFVKRAGADSFEPRLQAPAVLGDGDEIAFGNVTFVFRAGP